jgi:hypothetical protein
MKANFNSRLDFDETGFRILAQSRLLPEPAGPRDHSTGASGGARDGASDYDLNPDMTAVSGTPLVAAAVLVPIILQAPLAVLLTERTAHLSAHAGQIAFPGWQDRLWGYGCEVCGTA